MIKLYVKLEAVVKFKKHRVTAEFKEIDLVTLEIEKTSVDKIVDSWKKREDFPQIKAILNKYTEFETKNGKTKQYEVFTPFEDKCQITVFQGKYGVVFTEFENFDKVMCWIAFVFDTEKNRCFINWQKCEVIGNVGFGVDYDSFEDFSETKKAVEKEEENDIDELPF